MANPYREVLRTPGAPGFVLAGLVARLPISMLGIGIVLLVEDATGSYGRAGAVAAVYAVVQALCSPRVARLVDRYGQARVMRPAIAVHVAGLAALVVLSVRGAPLVALFVAAALMGCTIGSVGTLVRARWSHVLHRAGTGVEARMHTAFSLESVLDEVVFMVGPVLVTVLAVELSPVIALAAAAAAVTGGGAALLAQRGSEPPPVAANASRSAVMRDGGMVVLVGVFTAVGLVFGSVEVVTVAFTEERDAARLAGAVLAAYAMGSLVAGLVYGAVQWRTSAASRLLVGVVAMAVAMAPVAVVGTVPLLTAALFVAGMAIAPTLIAGNALVRDLVAAEQLTEGLAWVSTAAGIGISAGAALSGQLVDVAGARSALLLPVGAAAAAAVVGLLGRRWLLRPPGAGVVPALTGTGGVGGVGRPEGG